MDETKESNIQKDGNKNYLVFSHEGKDKMANLETYFGTIDQVTEQLLY